MNLKDMIAAGGVNSNISLSVLSGSGRNPKSATVNSDYHEEFDYLCRGHSRWASISTP